MPSRSFAACAACNFTSHPTQKLQEIAQDKNMTSLVLAGIWQLDLFPALKPAYVEVFPNVFYSLFVKDCPRGALSQTVEWVQEMATTWTAVGDNKDSVMTGNVCSTINNSINIVIMAL